MTNPEEINAAMHQGINSHGEGDLQKAEQLYRHVLALDPEQSDALHYLGVIGLQTGHFDEAVDLIAQSLQKSPENADALANLGNALQASGRHEEAATRYREALALQPTAAIYANLGNAQLQFGQLQEAIESYRSALQLEPHLAQVRRGLAEALLAVGNTVDALAQVDRAIADEPDGLEMKVTRGNILRDLGRHEEAIECFKAVLAVRPDIAPLFCNIGNVLRQTGRLAEAVEYYERAIKVDPNYVEGHRDLAIAYQDMGEKQAALNAFRNAVNIDETCTKAWRAIAFQSGNDLSDAEVDTMQALLASPKLDAGQQMQLEFALGRVFEDRADYEQSARHYERGNRLHRDASNYRLDQDAPVFERIKSTFDTGFFERWSGSGVQDETPIFIVGMPRSGTTLVEQILASHPQVFGAGELMELPRAIASRFEMLQGVDYTLAIENGDVEDMQLIAESYLAAIRDQSDGAQRVTDKLPSNFLNLGLIRVLFPRARIIHCVRDPRDTCFSIYKHIFSAQGHHYGYDLEDLVAYYRLYDGLMEHWRSAMPGAFLDLQYESMVNHQEATTRKLLEYCGLPWDSACLDFHKSTRRVATISASQVRQPIYSGSVGAWRNYEQLLTPLNQLTQSVNSDTSR